MRILLIVNIILFISFQSKGQIDYIKYEHNGYIFKTDIKTIINFLHIETEDSSQYYLKELKEISANSNVYPSDSIFEFSSKTLSFFNFMQIIDFNYTLVEIIRVSDNEIVNYKVKIIKKIYPSHGIGESSDTFLVIIDKKKRREIAREIIRTSLAC